MNQSIKIDQDTKEVVIIMIIWTICFLIMWFFWYDFRNFTVCFFESFNTLFGIESSNCNIEDYNKLWQAVTE